MTPTKNNVTSKLKLLYETLDESTNKMFGKLRRRIILTSKLQHATPTQNLATLRRGTTIDSDQQADDKQSADLFDIRNGTCKSNTSHVITVINQNYK